MGVIYRVKQFFRAIREKPDPSQLEKVNLVLEPPLAALFLCMSLSDQAHSLRVLDTLQRGGHSDPDLLAAALLHDIGKSIHPLSILDRVIIVLANRLFPRRVILWGKAEPSGWRRPFSIASQHPHWGAELVAAKGASSRLLELIRRHQDPPAPEPVSSLDFLLAELKRADSEN